MNNLFRLRHSMTNLGLLIEQFLQRRQFVVTFGHFHANARNEEGRKQSIEELNLFIMNDVM